MKVPLKPPRSYSTLTQGLSAKAIRKIFLEYFVNENHSHLEAIPLAPYFDRNLRFINSGACQFARIFTGEEYFDYNRVTNSQKCIKLETKLEGLDFLGHNPHKLLFFESMGNWSFYSCDKKEACRLAWTLLTTAPFAIPSDRLFVSYFNGNEKMNLQADEEVREIWRELGVPENQIIPCSSTNFWKLGTTGPCGLSTKIHMPLSNDYSPRNMTELWDIGFVKYNHIDGVLKLLPKESISTALGLERLTSMLQQTDSCYHIDLFESLYIAIQKISGAPEYKKEFDVSILNIAYRQLADLSRAITMGLSDDVYPDISNDMRRMLRKALHIARTNFRQEQPQRILSELSVRVAESLQEIYPEVEKNLNKVQIIIESEENIVQEMVTRNKKWWNIAKGQYQVLQSISFTEYPDIVQAFRHLVSVIDKSTSDMLPSTEIINLRKKYGVHNSVLEKILTYFGRSVDWDEVHTLEDENCKRPKRYLHSLKPTEKLLLDIGITSDDSFKHNHVKNEGDASTPYIFPDVHARLLAILDDQEILSINGEPDLLPNNLKKVVDAEVNVDDRELGFIFDQTNFTTEGGNQYCDTGYLSFGENKMFSVNRVRKVENFVIHYVELQFYSGKNILLKTGSKGTLSIDAQHRLKLMRNNTLSHLLLVALKELFPVAYPKRVKTSHECCELKASVFGRDVDANECGKQVELKVQEYIRRNLPVRLERMKNSFQVLHHSGVLQQPGLIYPYKNIMLTTILDESGNKFCGEPCDFVHLDNTGDIGDIVIPHLSYTKDKRLYVMGITEDYVTQALNLEHWLRKQLDTLQVEADTIMGHSITLEQIVNFGEKLYPLAYRIERDIFLTPYLITRSSYADVERIRHLKEVVVSKLDNVERESLVQFLRDKVEKMSIIDKFVVYFCTLPLPFFANLSFIVDILYHTKNKFPTLFLCYNKGKVKGVCHVPKDCARDDFNAEIWMKSTLESFNNKLKIKDEEDHKVFCYLIGESVKPFKVIDYVESLTVLGKMVAETHLAQELNAEESVSR